MFDTLLTIISFVIVLGILVFFHELGHYWVARRNGIVVEEFGLGYPPRALKLFRYDGTDFTLNWLPFGGFARMKGEDAGDLTPGSFNAASRSARAATLFAGPAMNFLLAIVLFAASLMAGSPIPTGSPRLDSVSPAAASLGLQPGDVVVAYNGAPLRTPLFADDSLMVMGPSAIDNSQQLSVLRQGRLVTLPVNSIDAVWNAVRSSEYTPVLMTQVTGIAEASPAQMVGLLPGDIVYAVDGIEVTTATPLNELVSDRLGQEIVLTIVRNGEWLQLRVTPRVDPPPGQGALGVQISTVNRMASMNLLPALWNGVVSTGSYAMLVLQLPMLLFQGQISPEEAQVSGPVGIAQMIGGAMSATIDTGFWFPILRLSAVLSAALAITNLLPLPALDGGRLLFIFIETIRGRRVSPEREGLIHMIGFALLLGLMLFITVRDLSSTPQTIDWARLMGQ
ncbi:MAG: RIP metalloprotease RseP [Caldilinea sp.]